MCRPVGVLERCDGHPNAGPGGLARFEAAVVRELPRWGGSRRRRAIISAVYTALVDSRGVPSQRRGALERARYGAGRLARDHDAVAVESRMVEVLDKLGLTELATSIPGL